jgi:two-component system sensor histidine kinase QseC
MTDENHTIIANQQLIFTCIRNIMDNAIRYAPEHGHVYIILRQQQDLELIIENEGRGLNEAVFERLGERFYRALGTKTQGSGLGLSIFTKIIELHHGKITFSQSQHGGLSVRIRLALT